MADLTDQPSTQNPLGDLRKVNARRLARRRAQEEQAVALGRLARLTEALRSHEDGVDVEFDGNVRMALRFSLDHKGRTRLQGRCTADLPLTCMTCLLIERRTVQSEFYVHLVTATEVERLEEDERLGLDLIETDPQATDLLALIEDELLLSLPEQLCETQRCPNRPELSYGPLASEEGGGNVDDSAQPSKVTTQRPFSELKTLLKERQSD